MNESVPQCFTMRLTVNGLNTADRGSLLVQTLQGKLSIDRVDVNLEKQLIRVVSSQRVASSQIQQILTPHHFFIAVPPDTQQSSKMIVAIDGMTCHSCEVLIEQQWKKLPGVESVAVDAHRGQARIVYQQLRPTLSQLQGALNSEKYHVRERTSPSVPVPGRPSFVQLIGLFAIVLLLGKIASSFGLLQPNASIGSSTSFGAVFLLGLVAASSSCIAVSGGLLLSSAAKFNQRYAGTISSLQRMRPVFLFVGGRLLSYAFLGGVIGLVGETLSPPPLIVGFITIIAALAMLVMGLDMLNCSPVWLKRLLPRMPKRLSHTVMDIESGQMRWWTPMALGAGTFFLPCGFTQALQLYALTTGSALTSGLLLFVFALGTAPSLLALGWASGSLKGKVGQLFFRFSGALVIVLGLWNIQNGFTITGYPLTLPNWSVTASASTSTGDPNVSFDGTTQTVKMIVTPNGYEPNRFTVRAGVPTRWAINADDGGGCAMALQAPQLGIRTLLKRGDNVIEFTPQSPGIYSFSCSMGMYRGQITVIPNT